jgi:methionyl-tRNA formyltransferase
VDEPAEGPPGALSPDRRRLFAACGEGTVLELLEVQPAGRKQMTVEAFLNGYRPVKGERLGD